MNQVRLYRKRFIPDELVYLKDDIILFQTNKLIITKWTTLKPRKDISSGISAFFMEEGYKVSKIYNSTGDVVYWYCDIINTKKDLDQNSIVFEDLLVDVLVYEDGFVKVIDTSELADALDTQLISSATASQALHSLDALLSIIYNGEFHTLQAYINDVLE
jgi:predicted RNA-binding protein associated with RNAse of E/G family